MKHPIESYHCSFALGMSCRGVVLFVCPLIRFSIGVTFALEPDVEEGWFKLDYIMLS